MLNFVLGPGDMGHGDKQSNRIDIFWEAGGDNQTKIYKEIVKYITEQCLLKRELREGVGQ